MCTSKRILTLRFISLLAALCIGSCLPTLAHFILIITRRMRARSILQIPTAFFLIHIHEEPPPESLDFRNQTTNTAVPTHHSNSISMSGAPYLHPSKRNYSTDQVGPSTHQNSYNKGVLLGNWYEERIPKNEAGGSPNASVGKHEWPQSTSQADYGPKRVAPRPMLVAPDLGRQLLFGQDATVSSVPSKTVAGLQAKQAMWRAQNNPDNAGGMESTSAAVSRSVQSNQARSAQ